MPTSIAAAPSGAAIDISVLMATYEHERPERLARALESMFRQTIAPDEMVLVVDGPIPPEQERVIARYQQDARIQAMVVVRLEKNQGLGPALNAGLAHCRGTWVMRMDSDDESMADRVAVQRDYLSRHPDADIIGGWSEEFFEGSSVTRLKSSPISHEAITKSLPSRNILVHPSLMIRAEKLRAAAGYRGTYPLLEDWDLYIRMMLAGCTFAVVPKVLVRMLVGRDMAKRRGGLRYLWRETRFRWFLRSSGVIGTSQFVFTMLGYAAFRLVGSTVRNRLYNAVRIVEDGETSVQR